MSVGLANRLPGEVFKNPDGDEIIFQEITFYPKSGKANNHYYPGSSSIDKELLPLSIMQSDIAWTNAYSKCRMAFGLSHFKDSSNNSRYYGRWFNHINLDRTKNYFPNNSIPGSYRYAKSTSTKEYAGYMPSQVLTCLSNNTPDTIYDQIKAKFGRNSDEARATRVFMKSNSFPVKIPKGSIHFEGFKTYFCEMLHPMAVVMEKPIVGLTDSSNIFYGVKHGYSKCTINFNPSTIGGLSDSQLVNSDGEMVKLSSKAGQGAHASAVNLLDIVREIECTDHGRKMISDHPEIIEILEIIKNHGHVGAPLKLAIKYGLLTQDEEDQVRKLKEFSNKDKIIGSGLLSSRLETLYKDKVTKKPDQVVPLEHMLAAIAKKVTDYINYNTNFSKVAVDILNHTSFIQIYTNAKETDDSIIINEFKAVCVDNSVTGVYLTSQKSYMSTMGSGNICFKIKR